MNRVGVLTIFLVFLAFLPGALAREESEVSARLIVPAGEFTVGDLIELRLVARHPAGTVFDLPDASVVAAGKTPSEFVVEQVEPAVRPEGGAAGGEPAPPGETAWTVKVRPFATGDLTFPALSLSYRLVDEGGEGGAGGPVGPGAAAQSVATEPAIIHVHSVLPEGDNPPAGIKDPWWLRRSWWSVILGALAAILLGVAVVTAWRRYRRRLRAGPAAPAAAAVPEEPPYERALRELEALLAGDLLARGKLKEFHIALSEIIKRFLAGRYRFDALDRTTAEVLADLSRSGADPSLLGGAAQLLGACDLVKFAKHRPAPAEIDETVGSARALIETGRPPLVEEAAA